MVRRVPLGLLIAAGLAGAWACSDNVVMPPGEGGPGGGGTSTQGIVSATAPDGLVQYVTVSIDTSANSTPGVTISTYVFNSTFSPVTAILRGCALQPDDFIAYPANSITFTAPDQAGCAGVQDTVSLLPGAVSDTLTDTYLPKMNGGVVYTFAVRQILQPEFWAPTSVEGKGPSGGS